LVVVGLRTLLAALLLLILTAVFGRKYFYIYPAGLIGCGLAGFFNGIGSILYYSALGRINASLGQLLYSLYPLFVAIWLILDSQPPSRLTLLRILLAIISIVLLTSSSSAQIDMTGVAQMLLAAVLYALHLPINQRVLYDIPAPTVTLYTLISMSIVVSPVFFFVDWSLPSPAPLWPILGLTLVTFLSRLSLFMGVKHLGGMQTAILGLLELLVTVGLSIIWLRESFSFSQWIGGALLGVSILLVYFESPSSRIPGKGGWFSWLRPPSSLSE
jgi:drug/metabolite transporter (DMT)-like permease